MQLYLDMQSRIEAFSSNNFKINKVHLLKVVPLVELCTIKPNSTECVERRFSKSGARFMIQYLSTGLKSVLSRLNDLLRKG